MKLTTAGESHGKAIIGILEGVPSNLDVDIDEINFYLALRQGGYGRGARQKIERDEVEILSGVRNKRTLGSPIAFVVKNRDYESWKEYMAPEGCDVTQKTLTRVRPGHADLTGMIKYDHDDARNVLERSSARETCARVVAGTIARQYLRRLGVDVAGYVRRVCGVDDHAEYPFEKLAAAKEQPLMMLDGKAQTRAMEQIDKLRDEGDTAGGLIEVRVKGLKSGFGSCMTYSQKLDAALCGAVMGVQAIKGVEIGLGFKVSDLAGSKVHDQIYFDGSFYRRTNNAGGIEGGMSNGEDIILRAAMKPIPTLMRGLDTVDYITRRPAKAASERSDVAAICAAEIVVESVVALTIAEAVQARIGGDNMRETEERYALIKQV